MIRTERSELEEMLARAPAGHSAWSVQRVRKFKAACLKARKVLESTRSTSVQIANATYSLRPFYRGEP
jgi:hypothetical protein